MAYVVTGKCIQCKHTDCVSVCPTDSFHEGVNFLVINPEDCIDCGLCVSACPIGAIYEDKDLPESERDYLSLNAELSSVWPNIIEKKDALPEADRWRDVEGKMNLLVR
jgi:ferredoxin